MRNYIGIIIVLFLSSSWTNALGQDQPSRAGQEHEYALNLTYSLFYLGTVSHLPPKNIPTDARQRFTSNDQESWPPDRPSALDTQLVLSSIERQMDNIAAHNEVPVYKNPVPVFDMVCTGCTCKTSSCCDICPCTHFTGPQNTTVSYPFITPRGRERIRVRICDLDGKYIRLEKSKITFGRKKYKIYEVQESQLKENLIIRLIVNKGARRDIGTGRKHDYRAQFVNGKFRIIGEH